MSKKKSSSTQNLLDTKIKSNRLLSKLFNPEEKKIFIKNNKNALKYYKEFVKMQKNKTRNSKLSLDLLNLNTHANIEKFKNNPILILKSYDKILFDEKKRKFKSQTLGVDEGLIKVPKNYNPIPQSPSQNRLRNNIFLKETEKFEGDNNLSSKRKIKNITELEKGKEIMFVKNNNFRRGNSEKGIKPKVKKFKKQLDNQLNYNFELKKLDNWDFLNSHEKEEEETSKNLLVLNSKNFKRRSSLINIDSTDTNTDFINMGMLLKIKYDKNKLKAISRIKQLKDFFTDFGKEQDVLLFSARDKKPKNYLISSFFNKGEIVKEEKKETKDNRGSLNYYKEMIRVKKRKEKMLHEELFKCAEKINFAKKEKEDYEKRGFILNQELKDLNEKETTILNNIKVIKTSKDKNNKNVNFNDLYSNELESDRKLIKTMSEEEHNLNNNNNQIEPYRERTIFNFSSDKKVFKRNYLLVRKRQKTIVFNNLSNIKKRRSSVIDEIKDNNFIIKEKQQKLKMAKDNFNKKVKFLKEYYYQILKKGLDVRKDGLSWVVVKLCELNSFIDKNYFPAFLSASEINYLMKVGIKKFELSELVKLFQLLKKGQKKLKEEHLNEDKEKIKKLKDDKFNQLLETRKGEKLNFGNDYAQYMEEIFRKYENVIDVYLNEKAEEDGINKICQKINKYVLKMTDEDIYDNKNNDDNLYEKFFIPGSLSQYFDKDQKFRQYFDDIYYLSEEINKRKNQLKEIIDNEFKKYKNLIKDNLNNNQSNKNTLISERTKTFSALFGNNIPV